MTPPEEKKERLKNCPFCGHKPNYSASFQDGRGGGGSIFCPNCRAGISIYTGSKNEVKELWNTRQSEKKVSVEKLHTMIDERFPHYMCEYNPHDIIQDMAQAIVDYVNGGKG